MSPPPAVVTKSADGLPEQPPAGAIAEELEKKLQTDEPIVEDVKDDEEDDDDDEEEEDDDAQVTEQWSKIKEDIEREQKTLV